VNWEAVGAIGEVVGAAAVVISLLYLAVQIRHSTAVARAATRHELSRDMQGLASDLLNTPDMARLLQRHFAGESLEPHELTRLQARAFRDFHFCYNAFDQYREGMLNETEWHAIRENHKQLLLYAPAYRDYWNSERTLFSSRFQDEMDRMMSEAVARSGSAVFESIGARRQDSEQG
jgi:hypothetical protein